jgi:putative transposase
MKSVMERRGLVEEQSELSIEKQCKLLSIHRSGFYYEPSKENQENLKIMEILDKQYFLTPFYGVLKLTALLKTMGISANVKRVRRLMKIMNWKTIYREPKTTISESTHYKYPYLLKNLKIERINQVWAADITYIPMKKGFMYLFAVIDLYSRKVVSWSISNTMTAEWCKQTVEEAIKKHGKPQIFNTDQGSQFTSEIFINLLKNNTIEISMDGKGRAIDNIFIERLWRTVKYENIYLYVYENGVYLYKGLNEYFEFYNNERLHQSINYQTPNQIYYESAVA